MKISILGLGWLGKPLAFQLLKEGFLVNGSCTTEEKRLELIKEGLDAFVIQIHEDEVKGQVSEFVSKTDILIINIPPKIKPDNLETYICKIRSLHIVIRKFNIRKIIYVSSTSVFKDQKNIPIYDEYATPNADTNKALQLIAAENLLLEDQNFETTVIRFGGLVGDGRHPVYFLAGRNKLSNPDAPVNLIHQKDCINIIMKVVDDFKDKAIYHGVCEVTFTKEKFYMTSANHRNLVAPSFSHKKESSGKRILSTKTNTNLLKITNSVL